MGLHQPVMISIRALKNRTQALTSEPFAELWKDDCWAAVEGKLVLESASTRHVGYTVYRAVLVPDGRASISRALGLDHNASNAVPCKA